jgi:uncharacterized protein YbbC (DUF1343 family)
LQNSHNSLSSLPVGVNMKNIKIALGLFMAVFLTNCNNKSISSTADQDPVQNLAVKTPVQVGADQLNLLIPKLRGKRIALVVNHTSLVGNTHLTDTLQSLGIDIRKAFAPEHGFRGSAADGEEIKDGVDTKTGLPVISLYGSNRKPTPEQLEDVDIVLFDIQDVGTRFYTYISTMHYVMEACAEHGKKLILLDRPNPNGSYVDGPVRLPEMKSFVGMHPIPIVHGLTIGELAHMINGEGWLEKGLRCDAEVIQLKNWKRDDFYSLPVKPSPNLPNDQAVRLYPSLCLFEGTVISVGRGTQKPFLVLGNPEFTDLPFSFTPKEIPGMSNNPPHEHKVCYGVDLSNVAVEPEINLQYLLDFYKKYSDKEKFFTNYFNTLAGTPVLQQQIKAGFTEEQIKETWQKDLKIFQEKRKKYLLYP